MQDFSKVRNMPQPEQYPITRLCLARAVAASCTSDHDYATVKKYVRMPGTSAKQSEQSKDFSGPARTRGPQQVRRKCKTGTLTMQHSLLSADKLRPASISGFSSNRNIPKSQPY